MYVKKKELGPVGGGVRQKILYVDPPMDYSYIKGYQLHWQIQGRRQGPPPNRIQFFCFRILFCLKVPTSEVGTPPTARCLPPPTGNPGSATELVHFLAVIYIQQTLIFTLFYKLYSFSEGLQKVKKKCNAIFYLNQLELP